ncbi:MAG: hypothetical protein ROO76_18155 [Terriglobia bacterium]|nr:hypothetical protein [Terriglobia bacterium]
MKTACMAVLLALASASMFAQSPFDGKWQLNQQKSDMTGHTMKIEDAGNGAIKFVGPNFTTTVKTDGTKAQTPAGATMAMQKKSDDSYHETDWMKGKEISQSDWTLSNDGKNLTIHEYGTNPNGEKFDNTTDYNRLSGSDGLIGEWKTSSVRIGTPEWFTMKLSGDELNWEIPAIKGMLKAPLNGKDVHPSGPTVPESLTLAITKKDPRTLDVTEKLQGKTIFSGTYTVSPDGKTMTVEGKNAKGEATKQVWEKQG